MKKDGGSLIMDIAIIQLALIALNHLGIINISWALALLPLEIGLGVAGLFILGPSILILAGSLVFPRKKKKKTVETEDKQEKKQLIKIKKKDNKENEKVSEKYQKYTKEELLVLRERLVAKREEAAKVKVYKK